MVQVIFLLTLIINNINGTLHLFSGQFHDNEAKLEPECQIILNFAR